MVNHDPEYIAELAAACKKQGVSPHGIGSYALQITMETWAKWAPAPIVAAELARRVDRMDGLEREQVDAVVADLRLEDAAKTQAPTNAILVRLRKATEPSTPIRMNGAPEPDSEPKAETRTDDALLRSLAEQAAWCRQIRRPDLAAACQRRAEWIKAGRPAGSPHAWRVGREGAETGREPSAT